MAIVVNVAKPQEQGNEPVVADDQAAPIIDANGQPELEGMGTVNDGHEDIQQNQTDDAPPPPPPTDDVISDDSLDTGSDGAPPPPVEDDSDDDVPPFDVDEPTSGDAPEPTPTTVGEGAPEPTQGDEPEQEPCEAEATTEEAQQEVETQQAAMTIDKEMKSQGKTVSNDHSTELVPVPVEHLTVEEQAKVRYSCGFTKNIGEFNSLRADVSIELPCAANEKAIDAAYNRAVTYVDGKVQELWNDA